MAVPIIWAANQHFSKERDEDFESRDPKQEAEERAKDRINRARRSEIQKKVGQFVDSLLAYIKEQELFSPIVQYGLPPVDFSKSVNKKCMLDGMRIEVHTVSASVFIDIVPEQGGGAELSVSIHTHGYSKEFIANLFPTTIFFVPDSTGEFNVSSLKSNNDKSFSDCFSTLLKQIAFLNVLQRLTLSNVAEMPGGLERDIRFSALDGGWMPLILYFEEKDRLGLNVRFDTKAYCFVRVKFGEAYLDPNQRKEPDVVEYCVKTVSEFMQLVDVHRVRALGNSSSFWKQFNPFKSHLILMDQKLTSMLNPSALDVDKDGCCVPI
jgi:hypothetical protein